MSFSGPSADRLAIRELLDSYTDAAARMDRGDWLACWTDDATWWTHYFDVSGKAAIASTYDGLMANVEVTSFIGQLGSCEIDGDRAECRSYAQEHLVFKDGAGSHKLVGRYEDTLRKEDGQWRFQARVYKVMIEEMG
ncbi:nuclear transport factor 2 family protein [Novosphingobium aquae]|uniref:Nuclear transport factor 2 family protein n=1 Tax=Novosphingobium aquae TaxID=3133435 RepID=A0ABU8SD18_9SPHN